MLKYGLFSLRLESRVPRRRAPGYAREGGGISGGGRRVYVGLGGWGGEKTGRASPERVWALPGYRIPGARVGI